MYSLGHQLADHAQPVRYALKLPPPAVGHVDRNDLYIHKGHGRSGRALDDATERFVDETRMGVGEAAAR